MSLKKSFFFIGLAFLIVSCSRNAITGRNQLQLLPEAELQSMAKTEYQTFLSQNKIVNTTVSKDAEMVSRVGNRIAKAITEYYTAENKGDILSGYQWEFNLVDSKDVNAWCMPGG
ncbi:MAG TPA: M48 family peptidase, partial [Agriterribacter sp.]|nr:M48 family peptidase [Agriterribacter sp.]